MRTEHHHPIIPGHWHMPIPTTRSIAYQVSVDNRWGSVGCFLVVTALLTWHHLKVIMKQLHVTLPYPHLSTMPYRPVLAHQASIASPVHLLQVIHYLWHRQCNAHATVSGFCCGFLSCFIGELDMTCV